jgi:hypothetical protein
MIGKRVAMEWGECANFSNCEKYRGRNAPFEVCKRRVRPLSSELSLRYLQVEGEPFAADAQARLRRMKTQLLGIDRLQIDELHAHRRDIGLEQLYAATAKETARAANFTLLSSPKKGKNKNSFFSI